MMVKSKYHIVNGITIYRLLAAPILIFLIFINRLDIFKWLLPVSFFTDMVDGYLARKYKAGSVLGAKLDSIADDFTIIAAMVGMYVFRNEFLKQHFIIISILFGLFFVQLLLALLRYGKLSSFHTYAAKTAALVQGLFMILLFLLPEPVYFLFYLAVFITAFELIEEIILVLLIPEWQVNIKGLYWKMREKQSGPK